MITTAEVQKIAKLAKLNFNQKQLEEFSKQLSNITDLIDTINDVDCSGVEPLTSVCDMQQRLRADLITEQDNTSELFINAPGSTSDLAKEIKCFIVPKVVE